MLYVIIAEDVPDSMARRQATRARHIDYLKELIDLGRVVLAGPNPAIDRPDPGSAGMSGSVIIAEFDSIESARAWAANDPYALEGVFSHVIVKPFIKVAP